MLWLVWLAYLLLAMRVRVCVAVSLCGALGSLSWSADVMGICFRRDAGIEAESGSFLPRVTPRYGPKRERAASPGNRLRKLRAIRGYVLPVVRACRLEEIALELCLGDAGMTAMAAGFARAVLSAMTSLARPRDACALRVSADFAGESVMLHARCIFSLQPGDIMFAALKAAVKKIGREGFGWKSIPLRA